MAPTLSFQKRERRVGHPAGTTNYLYDGAHIVEERDASGVVLAHYTEGTGFDEPLAMLRGSTTHYYQQDGLGSVTSLTDSSGAFADSYVYDSYGKVLSGGGAVANPFRYTGREWDSETSSYFYRARYLDSNQGRFISEDPIRFAAGGNAYRYVGNAPTQFTDPSGLKKLSDCVKQILAPYFPKLDLDKIELHEGLPGFTRLAPIDVGAITIGNDIWYAPSMFDSSVLGISAIGHELTHAEEYAKYGKPFFLTEYASDFLMNLMVTRDPRQAYEDIVSEVLARDKESKIFGDLLKRFGTRKDPCETFCK